MKVLLVGDAVVSSGFARCTHAAADALYAAGHEVHVLGINYHGDPHKHPYPIYPPFQPLDRGRDGFGVTRLPTVMLRTEPDVVVLLNDPWNIQPYFDSMEHQLPEDYKRPPIVGWLAVDSKNQQAKPLNQLAHVIAWTDFAADELKQGGYDGPVSVVPLGVDLDRFFPIDRTQARKDVLGALGIADDAFVIGSVGRNQPRKRLDLTLDAFARFLHDGAHNAYLFLHIGPTGDVGVDLKTMVPYFGVSGRILISAPDLGVGCNDTALRTMYNAFDVYLSTAQGEGWGLPCLEAMACGVPCIVPNWAAFGLRGWTRDAAIQVPCSHWLPSAPLNGLMHTIGAVPSADDIASALRDVKSSKTHRMTYSHRGLKLAATLPWERTGREVCAVLERVVAAETQPADTREYDGEQMVMFSAGAAR